MHYLCIELRYLCTNVYTKKEVYENKLTNYQIKT